MNKKTNDFIINNYNKNDIINENENNKIIILNSNNMDINNNIKEDIINNDNNKNINNSGLNINSLNLNTITSTKNNINNIIIYKDEKSYQEIINKDPELLFTLITEEKIESWKKILSKYVYYNLEDDTEILNTTEEVENKQIIFNDIKRTRVRESILIGNYKELLSLYISYYCNVNNIVYKQGLNEIFGAMLLIKYKIKISQSEIYNLIQGFINKFLTNYYYDNDLFPLKISYALIKILLKYHCPEIYNLFDKLIIIPEMYATGYLITIFSSKTKIDVVYLIWDKLIETDDSLFSYYLIVAFLQYNKNKILNQDYSSIPSIITKLNIENTYEANEIINIALKLRINTPYSFKILADKLEIFKYHSKNLKEIYEKIKPNNFLTLPIFPSEIFYICYKSEINCPDCLCHNFNKKNDIKEDNNINNEIKLLDKEKIIQNSHICELCSMNLKKNINYILFDLRIFENSSFEDENEKTGFLPQMIMIEQNILKNKNEFVDNITHRFINDKINYHFIFLTSKTEFFSEFEDKFYFENSKINNNFFAVQIKIDKELNKNLVKKISKKDNIKLMEYDNLKNLLISLLKNNYPFISYAYGGFDTIHDLADKYDLNLLNHDKKCYLCQKLKKKKNHILNALKGIFKNDNKKKEENNVEDNDNNKKYVKQMTLKLTNTINKNLIISLIQTYKNNICICKLIKLNEEIINKNNLMVLIIQNEKLKRFKTIDEQEEIFEQMENIPITNITKLKQEKNKKNLHLDYKTYVNKKKIINSFICEFLNEIECKNFINLYNQYKKNK